MVLSQNLDYNSQEIVKSVKHNSQNLYTLTTSTKKATFSLYEISNKKDKNLKIALKRSLEIPLGNKLILNNIRQGHTTSRLLLSRYDKE